MQRSVHGRSSRLSTIRTGCRFARQPVDIRAGHDFPSFTTAKRATWSLQFYHSAWPKRSGKTPVLLRVDNRDILRTRARFLKRSVFVELGPSVDRVKALMRGRRLTVVTGSGRSAFSLKGSSGATVRVARCVKAYYRSGTGAFAGNNSGAFGSAPSQSSGAFATPSSKSKSRKLGRAQTLEIALKYLNGNKLNYKILPASANYFKNFPVNWSYGPKSYGGMMVIRNSSKTGTQQLGGLLGDQARLCTDKSAVERKPIQRMKKTTIHRASGACSTNGQVYALRYLVIESNSAPTVIMIVEMIHSSDSKKSPGVSGKRKWRIDNITSGEPR